MSPRSPSAPCARRQSLARRIRRAVATAALLAAAWVSPAAAAEPLPSDYLVGVEIDWDSLRRHADESDNYHLTWHADGNLYGAYGDGWGFVRTEVAKRAIGVSRIAGWPGDLTGRDVWEGNAQGGTCCWARWNGKSWGMLAPGTDLHMWFTQGRPRALGFAEARIASSFDGGRSWRKADWAFTPADGMLMPTFMQLGQGYAAPELPAEITGYAYSFHTRYVAHPGDLQSPGALMLMRSPVDRVREREAYQFYAGTTPEGVVLWSGNPAEGVPVLEKPYLLDVAPSVAWNPHLGRFLMVMAHVPIENPTQRGVAFYESGQPWGPWREIARLDQVFESTIFFYQLPTKWMSADGSAVLAFTGTDGTREWDSLNTVRMQFVRAPLAP